MLSFYSGINFIAGLALACFGLVIYLGNNSTDTRAFSRYIACLTVWALSLGALLYFDVSVVSKDFLLTFVRYQYWIGIPVTSSFFYFALVYRKNPKDFRLQRILLLIANAFLLWIYLFTDLVIKNIVLGPRIIDRIPIFGSMGFVLFNILFAFFTLSGLIIMFRKWIRENDPFQRKANAYLFWSSVISFLPGVILAVILPLTNDFESYWLAPTITLGWVFFISYVIFRHKILQLKVLSGELLVFVLIGILFINTFLPN